MALSENIFFSIYIVSKLRLGQRRCRQYQDSEESTFFRKFVYLHWCFLKGGLGLENQRGACQLEEVQPQIQLMMESAIPILYVSLVIRTLT